MYCIIVSLIALAYVFWDVNYFLRIAFTIGIGRLFQKKCGVNDTTTIYGFCTTQDVDIFLRHMNNARYVRELDFARFHFYDRTGIYENIKAVDGHALQGASSIRYRRTIPIFSAYKVETKSQYENTSSLSWKMRSITGWMLIAGLILSSAYGAGLASTFTVPKYEPSIDTVQDIVDRELEWGATHDAWIFSLTLSTEPLIKQLVSQFRIYSFDKLKEKSLTRSMAYSIEKLPAGNFAIGEYVTEEAILDMMLMVEDFYYEQCVVMMRKSSPYTEKVSQLVGRLHQSGLLLAWETQVALKHLNYKVQVEVRLSRTKNDVGSLEPLNLDNVVGVFIVYAIGLVVSTAIFAGELYVHHRRTKNVLVHIE